MLASLRQGALRATRRGERARFVAGLVALAVISALSWLMVWVTVAPPVFGWSPVAVTSGSMAPLIDSGDIVVAAPYDGAQLAPGMVIVFNSESGGQVTHRIVAVTPDGDYVTRGDANGRIDSTPVPPDQIVGVGRLLVPAVGRPFVWIESGQWSWLLASALALAVTLWVARWSMLRRFNPWRDRIGFPAVPGERRKLTVVLPPLVVAVVIGLLTAVVTTTRTSATFVGTTDNTANSIVADTLEPPTAVGATATGLATIDLTWTPTVSAYVDGYNVLRSLGSGYVPEATVPGQPSASHTDTGPFLPGTTYFYALESYAGSWTSAYATASETTDGLADPQLAGSWGTGLTHAAEAGSDRGLVFVTGNEQAAHVHPLGSWGTGLTHAAEAGNERLLVFVAGHEHGSAPAPSLISVSYGGQPLTNVNASSAGTSTTGHVEIWVLNEAGIAAATDATFVPTWDTAPDFPMYSHSFYGGVDQTAPTGAQATNSSDTATPNPITTAALATTSGFDYVITGAVAGNNGFYTPQNGFGAGTNQNAGSTTTLGTAHKRAAAATETPSMQHSGPDRQAIAAVVLRPSATSHAPSVVSVDYGGQAMTNVTGISVGSSITNATEIWFLDEAGIAAATDGTFVVNWSTIPDLPSYSHAFFTGIDQSDPIGDTATGSSPAATPNPITTAALTTDDGDIVVAGATAGETGTYTPQNGFTLGNNQNNGSMTLGTSYKDAAAGTETPSMQHSAPSRQVIAGAVLNRRQVVLANAWTTGLTHVASTGDDRMLVFVAGMENGMELGVPPQGDRDLTSVTYGGQSLTESTEITFCSGAPNSFCARAELWYLLEAGIAAATDSTFVPTWSGDPPYELEEHYAAVTLDRVHQTSPIGNTGVNGGATNPIQPAQAVGTGKGDVVIVAALGGMDASYTPPGSYIEGTDQVLLSSTMATAYFEATSDGTEQPSMTFDGSINRQVVLATTIKTNGTP